MKRFRRRGISDIDLTPLLDVIFIVLMVVMCNKAVGDNGKIKELRDKLDYTISANVIKKTDKSVQSNQDRMVPYVVLYADYETNNPRTRHISLKRNNQDVIKTITITPGEEEQGFAELEKELDGYIEKNQEVPVLLVLNTDRILYRDKVDLDVLLEDFRKSHPNMYPVSKQE